MMETTPTGRQAKRASGKLAKSPSDIPVNEADRISWSDHMRKILIDLLIEEKDNNGFTDSGLKTQQWTVVVGKFNQESGFQKSMGKKHLQSQLFQALTSSRGAIGTMS